MTPNHLGSNMRLHFGFNKTDGIINDSDKGTFELCCEACEIIFKGTRVLHKSTKITISEKSLHSSTENEKHHCFTHTNTRH